MRKILIVNSSTRIHASQSRAMTGFFQEIWKMNNPNDEFIFRDVGLQPIPHIDDNWIKAAFIKPEDRTIDNQKPLELSNLLVDEIKTADIYVIGVPMYNWSIPSSLKAYIDQIMRINETWKFRSGEPDGDYVGLLEDKKLFVLSARGDNGYASNEHNAHMNFQTTYLQTVFKIMGVEDIKIFSIDNEEYGGEKLENSRKEIFAKIADIKY
ncbi:NAD(P)H-dependent oxidoreductase [Cruoricaptor ignavus]|uniref:FMN dependent NADH:quinone oxidoreductase n=1 Tax=Cruoricaptor ignavus TaxID=1118202 RepID=A0A7M1T5P1_9FLAO|nr:NAD(P)H-dependent oxidoreductase [Cruoricaptor ignavus]QOR74444.1 NAD(P)H-dependent oxidoreductase [Cruoricaptor ignavus]